MLARICNRKLIFLPMTIETMAVIPTDGGRIDLNKQKIKLIPLQFIIKIVFYVYICLNNSSGLYICLSVRLSFYMLICMFLLVCLFACLQVCYPYFYLSMTVPGVRTILYDCCLYYTKISICKQTSVLR